MEFKKVLARYYLKWYGDCLNSAKYCEDKGEIDTANVYREDAKKYLALIDANKEAIEFFSIGDNAYKYDKYLPEKFRGYK